MITATNQDTENNQATGNHDRLTNLREPRFGAGMSITDVVNALEFINNSTAPSVSAAQPNISVRASLALKQRSEISTAPTGDVGGQPGSTETIFFREPSPGESIPIGTNARHVQIETENRVVTIANDQGGHSEDPNEMGDWVCAVFMKAAMFVRRMGQRISIGLAQPVIIIFILTLIGTSVMGWAAENGGRDPATVMLIVVHMIAYAGEQTQLQHVIPDQRGHLGSLLGGALRVGSSIQHSQMHDAEFATFARVAAIQLGYVVMVFILAMVASLVNEKKTVGEIRGCTAIALRNVSRSTDNNKDGNEPRRSGDCSVGDERSPA